MSQISVSDIVNAKIVDLLLECCRKTVMECAYHYKFDAQEALGKMGLLTDYSALTNLTMSSVNMTMSMSGMNSETGSVSDVSVEGVVVKDDSSVKTKVLAENEGKKGKKEKVIKEKKEKVVKEKVVKEKVVKEKVVKEKKAKVKAVAGAVVPKEEGVGVVVPVEEGVGVGLGVVVPVPVPVPCEEVLKDDNSEISSESKKKGRPKKEGKEKVVKEKGRPKKEKKETESSSAIDDLFANLVAKDVVKEEAKEEAKEVVKEAAVVVVKKAVNEVVVSKAESEKQVPKVDVVNKIEFQGTTYLKSKNTGIVYNMEQDVVGKWNENTMTIDFEEEEEEEYEDE